MRITTLIGLLLLACTAWVGFLNPAVTPFYVLACAAVFFPLVYAPIPRQHFYIALLTAVALISTHLIRVPFLLWLPESFRYSRIGQPTADLLQAALLRFSIFSVAVFAGLCAGFLIAKSANAGPGSGYYVKRRPFFLKASAVVISLVVAAVLARAVLQLGFGFYTKFSVNPQFGFLAQLHPDSLVYPVLIVYLAKYQREISRGETSVLVLATASMIGLIMLSGSRRAIGIFGLALFIFYAADKGNFRLSILRAVLVGVVGSWLLIVTFAFANPLRSHLADGGGYGALGVRALIDGGMRALDLTGYSVIGAAVSRRVGGGMDGMLVVDMYRPPMLTEVFSPREVAARIPIRLIPRYRPENVLRSGRAVAIAYGGEAMYDVAHSGSVGLFAALDLMFGSARAYLAAFVLGVLWAGYFRCTARVRDPDVRFLFHFIGMQQLFGWVLSGNLDAQIPGMLIMVVLLVAYGTLAKIVAAGSRGADIRRISAVT